MLLLPGEDEGTVIVNAFNASLTLEDLILYDPVDETVFDTIPVPAGGLVEMEPHDGNPDGRTCARWSSLAVPVACV